MIIVLLFSECRYAYTQTQWQRKQQRAVQEPPRKSTFLYRAKKIIENGLPAQIENLFKYKIFINSDAYKILHLNSSYPLEYLSIYTIHPHPLQIDSFRPVYFP